MISPQGCCFTIAKSIWRACWRRRLCHITSICKSYIFIAFLFTFISCYLFSIYLSIYLSIHLSRCWTQGKADKLKYFKETHMWYVSDKCTLPEIIPGGRVYKENLYNIATLEAAHTTRHSSQGGGEGSKLFQNSYVKSSFEMRSLLWGKMSGACCARMPKAI